LCAPIDLNADLYGKDGRQKSKFLVHTKAALRDIAKVTDELNDSFRMPLDSPISISRVSAYLHLLLHQVSREWSMRGYLWQLLTQQKCIVLATRPILFSYLESRLSHEEEPPRDIRPSANLWALLQMAKDSAIYMLRILEVLKKQGLLECFLPFDLDATYTSAIVAQLAAHIDAPLLEDERPLNKIAYECLDEMALRNNQIAKSLKVELQRLESMLARLPQRQGQPQRSYFCGQLGGSRAPQTPLSNVPAPAEIQTTDGTNPSTAQATNGSIDWFGDIPTFDDLFAAPHMTSVAESIELNGMEWWFQSDPQAFGQDLQL
jgi:proline utilization trans-activator